MSPAFATGRTAWVDVELVAQVRDRDGLEVDPLELLSLADKVPPELQLVSEHARARRFFTRAREIASADDWDALLELLEKRQQQRDRGTAAECIPTGNVLVIALSAETSAL
jgi:hypothetical protein